LAKSGLKHIDVGAELTKTEWESEDSHEVVHGNSFPGSPVERQLFYRDDEHKWYIYNASSWVWLGGGGGGMAVHGNEYHDPDFEPQGVAASLVETHRTTATHTQPQPPSSHKTSHQDGGADEISVAGLSGLLADGQTPLAHKTSHQDGGTDEISVAGLSGELADPQPSNFLKLSDTPSSYSGQAGKVTKVKSSEDGLEFGEGGAGGGDYYALTRFLLPSRYHVFPGGTNTTHTLTANQLCAVPFFTPVARTVTRLAIHVTTAFAGNARLGVYQDNGSIYPGALVLDAGTVDTGTTGLKEITGLNISLAANTLYWLALVANAASTIAGISLGQGWTPLGYGISLATQGSSLWTVSYTYDTLPATFPGGATASVSTTPKIAIYF
jgi:hypothetical protein